MKDSKETLKLKKLTLTAWTDILFAKGVIDIKKCNQMKSLIDKLSV